MSDRPEMEPWPGLFMAPLGIPPEAPVRAAIMAMIKDRVPGVRCDFSQSRRATNDLGSWFHFGTMVNNDPWRDMQDLARSRGLTLTYDAATRTARLRNEKVADHQHVQEAQR